MHFVVQENLFSEDGHRVLIDTLVRFNIPHTVVKIQYFTHDLIPEPQIAPGDNVVCLGATTMTKIAQARGWAPGSFMNGNFDYAVWRAHMGGELLNADTRVARFADVDDYWPVMFIRPCLDDKTFTGRVMDFPDFAAWRHAVVDLKEGIGSLNADTMVSYGPVKDIYAEYRFFVLDGEIVTGSLYRMGGRPLFRAEIEDDVLAYARAMVALWQPARGFIIDIARVPGGFKIVEYNNLNAGGFYACDVQKLTMALNAFQV